MPLPTKEEKRTFINDLVKDVTTRLLEKLENDQIPEEWDGHELRQLLADNFARQVSDTVMKGKRKREYKNTVAVNNL